MQVSQGFYDIKSATVSKRPQLTTPKGSTPRKHAPRLVSGHLPTPKKLGRTVPLGYRTWKLRHSSSTLAPMTLTFSPSLSTAIR